MLNLWHRTAGILAALIALVLVISGLLLAYTDGLGLARRHVTAEALLDWYTIRPPAAPKAYVAHGHWLTQIGRRVYYDDRELLSAVGELIGAVAIPQGLLLALDGEVLFLTPEGEILDRLSGSDGVPSGMRELGLSAGALPILKTRDGAIELDPETLGVRPHAQTEPVTWVRPGALPEPLAKRLAAHYRGTGLSLERVLLDLHTGRILGPLGVLVVNLTALLLAFLALSGSVMWLRRWRRIRRLMHWRRPH